MAGPATEILLTACSSAQLYFLESWGGSFYSVALRILIRTRCSKIVVVSDILGRRNFHAAAT
ncbi:hypothetical protein BV22DRAFT_1039404 [Leucogyrophana mollusca]|uniref:Uncharacterized protein n=1 Tax=Leucogyrophana mollusca TaxID=85980 RepID=A0ACB8B569_9AGAM|nr:hypothetical protein BV22DRAFT_1039404 [Leucogyrophana mollusca]